MSEERGARSAGTGVAGQVARFLFIVAMVPVSGISAQLPLWPVAAKPITVVGVTAGDANHEMVGILGATRQSDGHLIVAASEPLQVRRFDAQGQFLSSVGHRGSGPGEYRGRLTLTSGQGDSILLFDDQTTRWTLYQPAGGVVRSWISTPGERARIKTRGFRRTLIHPTGLPLAACIRSLLASLPLPRDSSYREVFPDGVDRAWWRDEASAEWTVRLWDGRGLGRVALPKGYELLQIGSDFVVGRRRDADGLERIEVLRVNMPKHAAPAPCANRSAAESPDEADQLSRSLEINLRNLEAAGEAYHADYGRFPGTIDSLTHASGFTLSPGVMVQLHAAPDGLGWDAIARTADSPRFCRILIGDVAPIWLYRIAFCGP